MIENVLIGLVRRAPEVIRTDKRSNSFFYIPFYAQQLLLTCHRANSIFFKSTSHLLPNEVRLDEFMGYKVLPGYDDKIILAHINHAEVPDEVKAHYKIEHKISL